jgi:hypothetical protein
MISIAQNKMTALMPGVIANSVVFAMLAYVAFLHAFYPDLYYLNVQEDEFMEWATFWSFFLAAIGCAWAALRQWQNTVTLPWFLAGLSLFCFVVAMEEISWAQRVFAYRPPTYFLAENDQQELNFHNFVTRDLRKLALYTILSAYGILLPVLARIPISRRLLNGLGIIAPPLELLPIFAVALALTLNYPWRFTNETVEFMMGAGFLFAAVAGAAQFSGLDTQGRARYSSMSVIISAALVIGLALGTVAIARYGRAHDPDVLKLAGVEIDVLRRDFIAMAERSDETFPNRKNLHKRIYSYESKYGGGYLFDGEFSALVSRGLPQERADFFLDPWNSPYWIRLKWDSKQRTQFTAFVYSFGPNRRRDSTQSEILGDDVGTFVFRDRKVRR